MNVYWLGEGLKSSLDWFTMGLCEAAQSPTLKEAELCLSPSRKTVGPASGGSKRRA